VKKELVFDKRVEKELKKFPRLAQLKFRALFQTLETDGFLEEPFAKKLAGQDNLFEIRVKHREHWRVIYAYFEKEYIIVLSAFGKKTKKTPGKELTKAKKRLQNYKEIL